MATEDISGTDAFETAKEAIAQRLLEAGDLLLQAIEEMEAAEEDESDTLLEIPVHLMPDESLGPPKPENTSSQYADPRDDPRRQEKLNIGKNQLQRRKNRILRGGH